MRLYEDLEEPHDPERLAKAMRNNIYPLPACLESLVTKQVPRSRVCEVARLVKAKYGTTQIVDIACCGRDLVKQVRERLRRAG